MNRFLGSAFSPRQLISKFSKITIQDLSIPPKKPLNAYTAFVQEKYSELKGKPNVKNTDIIKTVASYWRELDPQSKSKYQNRYSKEKQQYLIDYQKYLETITKEEKTMIKREKSKQNKRKLSFKLKKLDYPKRPRNAYSLYLAANKTAFEGKNFVDVSKENAKNWNNMTEKEKELYSLQATKDQIRYEKELEEWKIKMKDDGFGNVLKKMEKVSSKRK